MNILNKLEQERTRLQRELEAVSRELEGVTAAIAALRKAHAEHPDQQTEPKRTFSPEARERMSAAQRLRWAARREAEGK